MSAQPFLLLAQAVQPLSPKPLGSGANQIFGDLFWVIAAALGVGLILLIWAKYLRRSNRKNRRHSRPGIVSNSLKTLPATDTETEAEDDSEEESGEGSERRRRRRRKRGHRPRNPTLAETGGLPPVRPPESRPPML